MNTEKRKKGSLVKNILLGLLAIATVVVSVVAFNQYNQRQQLEEDLVTYKQESAEQMQSAFQRIGQNLAEIGQREGAIQQGFETAGEEGLENPEEAIEREIAKIEQLIAENEQIINDLNLQVEERDKRLAEYDKTVKGLNSRLSQYRSEVAQLVAEKKELGENLAKAESQNQDMQVVLASKQEELQLQHETIKTQEQQLQKQDQELHTAYYIMGPFKELRDKGVMEKEGGIIGIAAAKEVKDDFSKDEFIEVDIRHTPLIPVFSKDAELASIHPSGTYEWVEGEGNPHWLRITDPQRFWESTKYLVIVTKGDVENDVAQVK